MTPTLRSLLYNYSIIRGSRGRRNPRRRLMYSRCRGAARTSGRRGARLGARGQPWALHWGTRPGLPHAAHPSRTRHAGAAASNAVESTAKAFRAPLPRGNQNPSPPGLAAGPCLAWPPLRVYSRPGLRPVLGSDAVAMGEAPSEGHRWRPPPAHARSPQFRSTTETSAPSYQSVYNDASGVICS